ncbi:kinase-like protein [Rhizopogon salebrosus TDB-379]|nr:kinase-like protein [Rhizopogon salebrosus TDB-379]
MSEAKLREWLKHNNVREFTFQLAELGPPITSGSFGQVYQRTVITDEGKTVVAVKKFLIDHGRAMAKMEKGIGQRELTVWLKLRHSTIVPLLGIAFLDHPFPALVSQWMPSGTLDIYLEKQATTLTAPAKVDLAMGVADGLNYLHSENVVHGDLHPGNVLIDGSGNPCLTDFGLATVVGDAELQLTTTIANRNPRWHAPEVIGIDREPGRSTFKSDIYSFGSVMFFIASGDVPWPEKRHSAQIIIELSRRVKHVRPGNILDDHWNLVQKCWSWDPENRLKCAEVLKCMSQFRIDDPQACHSPQLPDLTGQIFGATNDYVARAAFGDVYRCEWRRPTGPVKVAVKVVRFHTSKEDSRVCIYITLLFTLFYVDLLEISTRGVNLGASRPRKYCFSFWNNGGVWAVHSPCVSVVPARHVVPTNYATRY